jgi:hypothetical protein
MIMTIVLLTLFTLLIRYMTRPSTTGFTTVELAGAFTFKVIMACLYGYLFLHYYNGDDTWKLHDQSLKEYQLLMERPGRYFWEWTPVSAWRAAGGDPWQAFQNYLVDLEYFMITKVLGIFNIISRGNYYSNAVFFSFLTFWGHYWLFKLLTGLFPQKRTLLLLLIFFFPPALFWLSGIRTDGLLLTFLSLLLLHLYNWLHHRKKASLLYAIAGFTGVLILRNMLTLLLLPAVIGWCIAVRYKWKPWKVFVTVYAVSVVLFFGSALLSPRLNLPAKVAQRQQEFLTLTGNTRFQLDTLQPTLPGFARVLPQAFANSFLRPLPWEAKGMLQVMAALETVLFWVLLVMALVRREKDYRALWRQPLLWVLLFFSVSLYLFIGYTVPFPGAIVRYKIIPELFLFILIACSIRLRRS